MRQWDPEVRAEAIRLYKLDQDYRDIEARTGVPRRTVSSWAKLDGLPRRSTGPRYRLHDGLTQELAVQLYLMGEKMTIIGAQVGASSTAIRQWVRNAGHPLRVSGAQYRLDTQEVARLHARHGSQKAVAEILQCSRSTVSTCMARARQQGL